jgi:hypothetical protein
VFLSDRSSTIDLVGYPESLIINSRVDMIVSSKGSSLLLSSGYTGDVRAAKMRFAGII